MMSHKVAIVGSRKYPDLDAVRDYVAMLPANTIIVSGGAAGVDSAAESAAKARGLQTLVFKPDYAKYGRYDAPKVRNTLIIEAADEVVAFHYNHSGGTQDSIDKAHKAGKSVTIITPVVVNHDES